MTNSQPERSKDWRKMKWKGIMLNPSNIDEYIKDLRMDTKGQYITQGVSFNKDDALQMNLLKNTLLTHGTFSGFMKHLMYSYFANQKTEQHQIHVQQQFILQQNGESGLHDRRILDNGTDAEEPRKKNIVQKEGISYDVATGESEELEIEVEEDRKPQEDEEVTVNDVLETESEPEDVKYEEPEDIYYGDDEGNEDTKVVEQAEPDSIGSTESTKPPHKIMRKRAKLDGISKFLESNPNAKKPTN